MDLREQITVNGVSVRLKPYTELRYKELIKVEADIDKYAQKNEVSFREMPKKDKVKFWMRKARILWEPQPRLDRNGDPVELNADFWDNSEKFFTEKFFSDEGFEYPLLGKSQDFFLTQEMFL